MGRAPRMERRSANGVSLSNPPTGTDPHRVSTAVPRTILVTHRATHSLPWRHDRLHHGSARTSVPDIPRGQARPLRDPGPTRPSRPVSRGRPGPTIPSAGRSRSLQRPTWPSRGLSREGRGPGAYGVRVRWVHRPPVGVHGSIGIGPCGTACLRGPPCPPLPALRVGRR